MSLNDCALQRGLRGDGGQPACARAERAASLQSRPMPNRSAGDHDQTPAARLAEGPLHGVLGYQLAQATIVARHVFAQRVGTPLGLKPVEYTVLALVHANPGVSARQISRGLALTPPNITLWLDRLEARGLVERRRSTSDARMQHLHATVAGAALAADCTARLLEGEVEALAGALSGAERAMLIELVHKAALARRRGSG